MSRVIVDEDFLREFQDMKRRLEALENNYKTPIVFDTIPTGSYGDEILYAADPLRGTYWHMKYDARPPLYSTITNTPGLVRLYKMNETSGTVMVDSVGGQHGTYVSSPNIGSTGLWSPGDETAEKSVNFNGSTHYATIPTYNFISNPSFSIEVLVQGGGIVTATGQGIFWVTDVDGVNGRSIILMMRAGNSASTSGQFDFDFWGDNFISSPGTDNPAWHRVAQQNHNFFHVVITYDHPTRAMKMYVNGQLEGSKTATTPYASTSTLTTPTINVGRQPSGGGFYSGNLGFLAMYNRAITADEVREHSSMMRAQYPWAYMGGAPLSEYVQAEETVNSVYPTPADPSTYSGPRVPILKSGIWTCDFGAEYYNSTAANTGTPMLYYGNIIDGVTLLHVPSLSTSAANASEIGAGSYPLWAASALTSNRRRNFFMLRYAATGAINNNNFRNRWIKAWPNRLAVE